MRNRHFALLMVSLAAQTGQARQLWVDSDTTAARAAAPLATLAAAVQAAQPGDTIYLKSGTYLPGRETILERSGTRAAPITLSAAPGAQAIIDLQGRNSCAIRIRGAFWQLKNFTIRNAGQCGVRVVGAAAHDNLLVGIAVENCAANGIDLTSGTTGNTLRGCSATGSGHNGIRLTGGASRNTVVQARTFANHNTGLQIDQGAAANLILNCDSWENYDAPTHGQDADGFGIKHAVGLGNTLRGCRAWHNADDGFDCWYAGAGVRFEQCYAWRNGENLWHDLAWEGNGNGFKLGQMEGAHELVRCAVWDQPQRGFDLNGNSTGVTLTNCTAIRCGTNFGFTFVQGNAEKNLLQNCLSFAGPVKIDPRMQQRDNSWNLPGLTLTAADFQSLDSAPLQGPRKADGSLPETRFLHLASTSKTIGAGIPLGARQSARPNFGAF